MRSTMRPDEEALEAEQERAENFNANLKKGVKTAANVVTTAAGIGATAKVLPFLSQYITPDVALKGISKVSPKLGGFLKRGMEQGLNLQDGLNFIKDNITGKPEKQSMTSGLQDQFKQEYGSAIQDFIANFSPDLDAFLKKQIKAGRTPFEAGALARAQGFEGVIKEMEQSTKFKFSDILAKIFGMEPPQGQGMGPAQAPQQAAQPSQAGQGDQMLSAAIDKLMKLL